MVNGLGAAVNERQDRSRSPQASLAAAAGRGAARLNWPSRCVVIQRSAPRREDQLVTQSDAANAQATLRLVQVREPQDRLLDVNASGDLVGAPVPERDVVDDDVSSRLQRPGQVFIAMRN
jgi:hypothetical protein